MIFWEEVLIGYLEYLLYVKSGVEATLTVTIRGMVNGYEDEVYSMFSKFSKDGSNVINLTQEELKNLNEFKLLIQSSSEDTNNIKCKFLSREE